MKLIIEDDEGRKSVVGIDEMIRDRGEVTIGRQEGNAVRLNERNVSRRHARLLRQNGSLLVEDLNSFNGVRVNGERIHEPSPIKEGDLLEIGDFDLAVEGTVADLQSPTTEPRAVQPVAEPAPRPEPKQPVREGTGAARAYRPQQQSAPPAAPKPAPKPAASHSAQATAMINLKDLHGGAGGPGEAESLPNRDRPKLYLLSTAEAGKEYKIDKTVMKIGREEDNDLVIDHRSLSRTHATLFRDDEGHWKVKDEGSANGTRVNGETYAIAPVESGDTIELGHLKLKFVAPGDDFDIRAAIKEVQATPAREEAAPAAAPAAAAAAKMPVALIAGVAAAVLLAVVAVVVVLTRSGGESKGSAGADGSQLLLKASEACGSEQFDVCKMIAQQALGSGADAVQAAQLVTKAEQGLKDQQALDDANRYVNSGDWIRAKAALDKVRDNSPLKAKKDAIWESIKGPYVSKALEKARSLLEACRKDDALGEVAKAESVDALNSEISTVREEIATKDCDRVAERPRGGGGGGGGGGGKVDAKAVLAEANQLIIRGDYDGAIKKLDSCFKAKPDTSTLGQCNRSAGVAQARLNNMPQAIKHWRKYIELVPDSPERPKLEKMIGDWERSQGG